MSPEQLDLDLVLFPSPGMGHLISAVEFAKRLLIPGSTPASITILLIPPHPTYASATASYINSISDHHIRIKHLPSIDFRNSTRKKAETIDVTRLIEAYNPLLRAAISPAKPIALILDFFCSSAIDVANDLRIPSYIYFTSNAATLCTLLHLPTLDAAISCEFDREEMIHIPGLPPVPPRRLPRSMINKKAEAYAMILTHARRFREAKGIILNTFIDLEPKPMETLASSAAVFAVGPVLASSQDRTTNECIKWLDGQLDKSVVFLCFGSMGCFSTDQVWEIATGLEKSGKRFLWVLRSPSTDGTEMPTDADLARVLPEGFGGRTAGRGMVWPSWAPQAEILGHAAVGGFVTHCGWNSCLESLWFGVPMLGWPLYAEQHLNCMQMVGEMGVALEVEVGGGGMVTAEEVERGVRRLMEGKEGERVRVRVEEMMAKSRRAVEDGGSSRASLQRFMEVILEMKMVGSSTGIAVRDARTCQ